MLPGKSVVSLIRLSPVFLLSFSSWSNRAISATFLLMLLVLCAFPSCLPLAFGVVVLCWFFHGFVYIGWEPVVQYEPALQRAMSAPYPDGKGPKEVCCKTQTQDPPRAIAHPRGRFCRLTTNVSPALAAGGSPQEVGILPPHVGRRPSGWDITFDANGANFALVCTMLLLIHGGGGVASVFRLVRLQHTVDVANKSLLVIRDIHRWKSPQRSRRYVATTTICRLLALYSMICSRMQARPPRLICVPLCDCRLLLVSLASSVLLFLLPWNWIAGAGVIMAFSVQTRFARGP